MPLWLLLKNKDKMMKSENHQLSTKIESFKISAEAKELVKSVELLSKKRKKHQIRSIQKERG